MSKTEQESFTLYERALKCAMQFVQDAGYECTHPNTGGVRRECGELVYVYRFAARHGPHVTRKTPVEQLVVRVRVTGPNHKTLRPSFVTLPPDGAGG